MACVPGNLSSPGKLGQFVTLVLMKVSANYSGHSEAKIALQNFPKKLTLLLCHPAIEYGLSQEGCMILCGDGVG